MRASLFSALCAAFCLCCPMAAHAGMEIIAHRGANSLAPENTLAAQRLAYEFGADTVECDVRLSKDGIPVIMHDAELQKTVRRAGLIQQFTLAELKQMECGAWFSPAFTGEPIPTLAEMLQVAKQYNRRLLLDIKGSFIVEPVVKAIRDSGIPLAQVPILTWWDHMTGEYTSRLPGAEVLRVCPRPDQIDDAYLADLRLQKVNTLFFSLNDLTPEIIRRYHAAGFKVSLLSPPKTAGFYYEDLGLDQFWTDFTDQTVTARQKMTAQWTTWAEDAGLAPDQRRTGLDPDGDGVNNLTEYALDTHPLKTGNPAPPLPDYTIPDSPTRSTIPTGLNWTVDLRENWNQFLTVTPQSQNAAGLWSNLPPDCCTEINPTRRFYKFPVGTGKKFFRLRFDVKQ